MSDPIASLRYTNPTDPALFDPLADPADAWDRARDALVDRQIEVTQ